MDEVGTTATRAACDFEDLFRVAGEIPDYRVDLAERNPHTNSVMAIAQSRQQHVALQR